MHLTERQKKYLRGLAHGREPVVLIGAHSIESAIESAIGPDSSAQMRLSPAVAKEFETALKAHELVKVRARLGDRDARNALFSTIARQTGSALVQRIGNVGVFYRRHGEKPRIILPAD